MWLIRSTVCGNFDGTMESLPQITLSAQERLSSFPGYYLIEHICLFYLFDNCS